MSLIYKPRKFQEGGRVAPLGSYPTNQKDVDRIKNVQRQNGVAETGTWDKDSVSTMNLIKKAQAKLGVTIDGVWGPKTAEAFKTKKALVKPMTFTERWNEVKGLAPRQP